MNAGRRLGTYRQNSVFTCPLHSCPVHVLALAVLAAASLWAGAAGAFEIEHSETRYADRRYQCDLNVRLDAPLDKVEAILRDYEKYPSLDRASCEARIIERPAPTSQCWKRRCACASDGSAATSSGSSASRSRSTRWPRRQTRAAAT